MIFTFGTGGGADPKELYEALKYSGLVTPDMTYDQMLEVLAEHFPEVPVGSLWTFNYSGSVEEFDVPVTGLYKFEVFGAQGGNSGGMGGRSVGYKVLNAHDKLYVCVGAQGGNASEGYNGGGRGATESGYTAYGGGGATHIANINLGELRYYSSNKENVLIVAGGGGGKGAYAGGTGGGTTGGAGSGNNDPTGGSQTAGGKPLNIGGVGGFGYGGTYAYNRAGGGGGGWYGGGAGHTSGGGGGSGYIGGVPSASFGGASYPPTTENGKQSGNGKASITLVAV